MSSPQPCSLSPVTLCGEEIENLEVKLSLGRREEWWEGVLRFSFNFSSYSDLIGNKVNQFSPSEVCFAHDGNF